MIQTQRLRILVVSPSLPYPAGWGFARRVLHLVDHLAGTHDVTMLSFTGHEVTAQHLTEYGQRVARLVTVPLPDGRPGPRRRRQLRSLLGPTAYHTREVKSRLLQQAFDELVATTSIDVVLLESSQLGWLRIPAGLPVVIDEHNVESELLHRMSQAESSLLRRAFNLWEYVRYARFERRVWEAVTACVTTSQRDAETILGLTDGLPVVVVPNGVDPAEFSQAAQAEVIPDTLVFAGLLSYRPNADGIAWFLEEVLPRIREKHPRSHLTIVGSGSPEQLAALRGPGVTATGWVTDVKPYVRSAAVCVVPLRMGGGTRLKVVEALSLGKAIVSTHIGSEGLDVGSGTHLELRDDPQEFADAVVALLDDEARRAELGAAARALVEQRYSWSQGGQTLEGLLVQVVRAAAGGPDRVPVR